MFRKFFYTFVIVIILSGCKQSGERSQKIIENPSLKQEQYIPIKLEGRYEVFGYRITPKAIEKKVNLKQVPTFYFLENQVKVSPDFSFGYFKDSIYNYEIKNDTIFLYGKNSNFSIKYEESFGQIELILNALYLEKLTVRKT